MTQVIATTLRDDLLALRGVVDAKVFPAGDYIFSAHVVFEDGRDTKFFGCTASYIFRQVDAFTAAKFSTVAKLRKDALIGSLLTVRGVTDVDVVNHGNNRFGARVTYDDGQHNLLIGTAEDIYTQVEFFSGISYPISDQLDDRIELDRLATYLNENADICQVLSAKVTDRTHWAVTVLNNVGEEQTFEADSPGALKAAVLNAFGSQPDARFDAEAAALPTAQFHDNEGNEIVPGSFKLGQSHDGDVFAIDCDYEGGQHKRCIIGYVNAGERIVDALNGQKFSTPFQGFSGADKIVPGSFKLGQPRDGQVFAIDCRFDGDYNHYNCIVGWVDAGQAIVNALNGVSMETPESEDVLEVVEYDGKKYRQEPVKRPPKTGDLYFSPTSGKVIPAYFDFYGSASYYILHEITPEPTPEPLGKPWLSEKNDYYKQQLDAIANALGVEERAAYSPAALLDRIKELKLRDDVGLAELQIKTIKELKEQLAVKLPTEVTVVKSPTGRIDAVYLHRQAGEVMCMPGGSVGTYAIDTRQPVPAWIVGKEALPDWVRDAEPTITFESRFTTIEIGDTKFSASLDDFIFNDEGWQALSADEFNAKYVRAA